MQKDVSLSVWEDSRFQAKLFWSLFSWLKLLKIWSTVVMFASPVGFYTGRDSNVVSNCWNESKHCALSSDGGYLNHSLSLSLSLSFGSTHSLSHAYMHSLSHSYSTLFTLILRPIISYLLFLFPLTIFVSVSGSLFLSLLNILSASLTRSPSHSLFFPLALTRCCCQQKSRCRKKTSFSASHQNILKLEQLLQDVGS